MKKLVDLFVDGDVVEVKIDDVFSEGLEDEERVDLRVIIDGGSVGILMMRRNCECGGCRGLVTYKVDDVLDIVKLDSVEVEMFDEDISSLKLMEIGEGGGVN